MAGKMPIQTATPEQVEQCVVGLKRTIDRQAATIARQAAEIERLRVALETIVAGIDDDSRSHRHCTICADDALEKARAALEPDHDAR